MIPRNWEKSLRDRGWNIEAYDSISKKVGESDAEIGIDFSELGDDRYFSKSKWWVVTIVLNFDGELFEFQPIYKKMYSALGTLMRAARVFDNFIEEGEEIPKDILEHWESWQ